MTAAANSSLLGFLSSGEAVGYQIERSLRFNSSDSAYLSRTPASAGNRKTWTYSFWAKLSYGATDYFLRNVNSGNSDSGYILFFLSSLGDIRLSGWATNWLQTTAVFRDPSAWYHILLAVDTTQATASNRLKLYINGTQITAFALANYPSQNLDLPINAIAEHDIGVTADFYLADVHLIDGQALTPSSFTEVSATTGQLIPKAYTGTFTGNSFWLKFADNSAATATTLGKDSSGLGNNWTPNNLSVTAGAGNDSLVDTPTSYGTDTGAGGEVRGNYCTWNPLDSAVGNTFSNGNLDLVTSSSTYGTVRGAIAVSSGKWYWEATKTAGTAEVAIGIIKSSASLPSYVYATADGYSYNGNWNGNKGNAGTTSAYGANYNNNDVIGVALDLDAGTLTFYKNGVSQGVAFTGLSGSFSPAVSDVSNANTATLVTNFGQRPFAYTAPSGFKALCDTNLPAPTIAKPSTVMDVRLYTGTGSSLTPTSTLGFNPDLIWIKSRSAATDHALYDAVRGAQARLESNTVDAEVTSDGGVTAFNSAGFTVGTLAQVNTSSATYAAWAWDAGSSTVTNTQGSITSSVRANPSAGFSIVTYTGTGANATVGHGLNAKPALILFKSRDENRNWVVYSGSLGATKHLFLNLTDGEATSSIFFNNTEPTSSVFSLGPLVNINNTGLRHVAYCFAPVAGYSAFGSYTGNGTEQFVYLGFRPKLVLIKGTTTSSAFRSWNLADSSRPGYNPQYQNMLWANRSSAEGYRGDGSTTADTAQNIDLLSNGFRLTGGGGEVNNSSEVFVYAAWAESPFQYARAR